LGELFFDAFAIADQLGDRLLGFLSGVDILNAISDGLQCCCGNIGWISF